MKRVIRKGVFETNSSSTHTVTISTKKNNDKSKREISYYEDKLEVLISSCQLKIRDYIQYLIESLRVCKFNFDVFDISNDLLKKIILKGNITLSELEEILESKVDMENGKITLEEYEYEIIPGINYDIERINQCRNKINNYLEAYCEYANADLVKTLKYHKDNWFIRSYQDPLCSRLFSEGPIRDDMCDYCPISYELENIRESYNSDKEFALAFFNGEFKVFVGEE